MKSLEEARRYIDDLVEDEVYRYNELHDRMHFIRYLAIKRGWKRGAELGVKRGKTFLRLLKSTDLNLIGIDLWEPQPTREVQDRDLCFENYDHSDNYRFLSESIKGFEHRAILIKDSTERGLAKIQNKSLDFVFIDADHSQEAVERDIRLSIPKLKDTGTLLGHDINWPSVRRAVEHLLPNYFIGLDDVWYIDVKDVIFHKLGL